MTRNEAFQKLKIVVMARRIIRAEGATIGTPQGRTNVDDHLRAVEARLRLICQPKVVNNL